jgi:hypothetical protein
LRVGRSAERHGPSSGHRQWVNSFEARSDTSCPRLPPCGLRLHPGTGRAVSGARHSNALPRIANRQAGCRTARLGTEGRKLWPDHERDDAGAPRHSDAAEGDTADLVTAIDACRNHAVGLLKGTSSLSFAARAISDLAEHDLHGFHCRFRNGVPLCAAVLRYQSRHLPILARARPRGGWLG